MTPEEHRRLRESLGDLAIGRLLRDEDTAVRAHLDGCAECRAELAEITSVLPALDKVDPERLDQPPAPPPDLGERIVAAARAERRRGTPRWVPIAAAAAAAVVIGGAAGYAAGSYDGIPREPVAVQALAPEIQASAVAIPHTWGMEVVLDGEGFRPGATYRMVVEASDGRQVAAGEFVGTGASPMLCNLNSSVLRADASGFRVLDTAGQTVLRGEL